MIIDVLALLQLIVVFLIIDLWEEVSAVNSAKTANAVLFH